jgi:hypothetical protein
MKYLGISISMILALAACERRTEPRVEPSPERAAATAAPAETPPPVVNAPATERDRDRERVIESARNDEPTVLSPTRDDERLDADAKMGTALIRMSGSQARLIVDLEDASAGSYAVMIHDAKSCDAIDLDKKDEAPPKSLYLGDLEVPSSGNGHFEAKLDSGMLRSKGVNGDQAVVAVHGGDTKEAKGGHPDEAISCRSIALSLLEGRG